jgi:hypothetical protein
MKRLIIILAVLVFANYGWCGVLDDNMFDVTATITSLGTDASSTALLAIPVGTNAGLILSIDCDSDNSDEHTTYIFREDIANWYTNSDRDNRSKVIYPPYASSTTDWTDTDPFPFSSDNNTIYLGTLNDDGAATATFIYRVKGKIYKKKGLSAVADTD